jgi:hypothetical protein
MCGSHLAGLDQGFDRWQRTVLRFLLHGVKLTYLVMFGKLESFPTWYESELGCGFPRRNESEAG